ncbi:COG4-domain-containing protein [Sistotremastrum suecicum HHB10207 ss-3]|uniref:Conserved oligomeric Golgi complex subunit 4 n=1 Tax=Sistotremastrum suecicum HHB10207 ss-3 TaxID=1314776 RepID=A0A166C269_9AGAM|nr:COG4-domain-containing protein [Sistotremastrum suecicum HHB10207 ss-3]
MDHGSTTTEQSSTLGFHEDLKPIKSLTSLSDILSTLSTIQSQEADISQSLSSLLSSREPIDAFLAQLQTLVPQIDEIRLDAVLLSEKVSKTAKTAERVGGRVRSLDEEMRRVRMSVERVGLVMELKSSLSSFNSAMEAQDYDSATRHCAKAMALPPDIIGGQFAEATVPTSELPLPPSETLQAAREQLLEIFKREFEAASRARDSAAISRFFKLFPAVGWEEEGLQAYAAFVVDLVRSRPPVPAKLSSPLYYVASLTSLFESIAKIVDQHQPVVEKYYGGGKMSSVIRKLLNECDRVVATLLEGWEEDRSAKRTVGVSPDDGPDPREIDKLLNEVASIAGRWNLFRQFLVDRLSVGDGTTENDPENSNHARVDLDDPSTEAGLHDPYAPLKESRCRAVFDDLLNNYYLPLETWYLKVIIEKAHRVATVDTSAAPPITTMPDDVFYVLKAVLTRTISAGDVSTVAKMTTRVSDILDRDLGGVLKSKLDNVYSGLVPSGTAVKAEKESRTAFVTHLNDLETSASHLERLIRDMVHSNIIPQIYSSNDIPNVQTELSSLASVVTKFRGAVKAGVDQIFSQLVRPRIRQFVTDLYKDTSYSLTEDSYAVAEQQDVVRKRFIKGWEALTDGFQDTFTEFNYRHFFFLVVDVLVRPWEKQVLSMRYTELGAIRFDHDLRSAMTFLSSQTIFGDVREKFQRLQQISTLLNLDMEEDVDDFYSSSGTVWKLNANEARSIVNLRVG